MPLEDVKRKFVVRNKCLFSTNESTTMVRHHFSNKNGLCANSSNNTAITQGEMLQGLLEGRARKRLRNPKCDFFHANGAQFYKLALL